MKATKYLRSIAPLVALTLLAIAVASLGGLTALAVKGAPPAATAAVPVGTALLAGPVFLNGHAAGSSSLTLTSGDRLETGPRGGAVLTLSKHDGLVVSEKSALTLVGRPEGLVAELDRGGVLVSSAHERLREVRLAGEAVSIRAEPGTPRRYQVVRLADTTYVMARLGSVSVFDEGYATHTEVPEGKVAAVRPEAEVLTPPQRRPAPAPQRPGAAPAPAPASGAGRAGQISVAIPKDYIVRGPQSMPGNSGDAILWNDLLKTETGGRVRLSLDDGSILNVGSGSQLKVEQHDNRTQQTSLQLNYGRVRAQVVKLTQPNAKFEIRTNTAVCGVLGTDFYIEADERSTRVVVFKGVVRVTSLIAGAVAGVAVGAGQASTAAGSSVSAPATASAGQVQGAISATQSSAAAGVQGAVTAVSASRVALVTAAPATAAGSIPAFTQPPPSPFRP